MISNSPTTLCEDDLLITQAGSDLEKDDRLGELDRATAVLTRPGVLGAASVGCQIRC